MFFPWHFSVLHLFSWLLLFTDFFGGKVYDKSYLNLYLRSQKSKDALFESICQNSSPSLPNFLLPPELHTVFPKRLLKLPFGSFFSCVYPLNLVWVHSILGLKYLWSKLLALQRPLFGCMISEICCSLKGQLMRTFLTTLQYWMKNVLELVEVLEKFSKVTYFIPRPCFLFYLINFHFFLNATTP